MSEEFIFKHRNRLKNHFVNVSKVLLYGYTSLSDGAKITFQVIDGFDWEDKDTGDSKGFVFPSTEMVAKIRNTTERTIRRHINELIEAKLITRQRRKYRASVLFIETVSDKEADNYFGLLKNNGKQLRLEEGATEFRTDKYVRSEKEGERTNMSLLYKKEDKLKENKINVNENLNNSGQRKQNRGGDMMQLGTILNRYDTQKQVQLDTKNKKQKTDSIAKRDYLAEEMADSLEDLKSLGAFRTIADLVPEGVIRRYLANIKETWREGKIKKSKGALFISMVQQYSDIHRINLGFKSSA